MYVVRKRASAVARPPASDDWPHASVATEPGLRPKQFTGIDDEDPAERMSGVDDDAGPDDKSESSDSDDDEEFQSQYQMSLGRGPSDSRDGIPSVYFFDSKNNSSPFVYMPSSSPSGPIASSNGGLAPLRYYHSRYITPRRWEKADRVRLRAVVVEQLKHSAARGGDVSSTRNAAGGNASTSTSNIANELGAAIDWTAVSLELGSGHTAMECLMQYRNVEEPQLRRLAAAEGTSSLSSDNVHNEQSSLTGVAAWSEAEARSLRDHVQRHGDCDWVRCSEAALRGLRSPLECIQYYQQHVNNALIRNDHWTEAEDASLRLAVRIYDFHWHHVSDAINGRTPTQCKNRWDALCAEEERQGAKAAEKRARGGDKDEEAGGEEGKGSVVHGRWDAAEERRLVLAAIALQAPVALDPSRAARKRPAEMPAGDAEGTKRLAQNSRTALASSERNRDQEPDEVVPRENQRRAFLGWGAVARFVPHRNALKCREKWVNVLDPTINRDEFTPEEDRLLLELTSARLGRGESSEGVPASASSLPSEPRGKAASSRSKMWSEIAQYFPGRTDNHVYRRWKQLCPKEVVIDYLSSQHVKRKFEPAAHGR